MSKVKEIKELGGGGPWYAAQAILPIDAVIGPKDHLWMETRWILNKCSASGHLVAMLIFGLKEG